MQYQVQLQGVTFCGYTIVKNLHAAINAKRTAIHHLHYTKCTIEINLDS